MHRRPRQDDEQQGGAGRRVKSTGLRRPVLAFLAAAGVGLSAAVVWALWLPARAATDAGGQDRVVRVRGRAVVSVRPDAAVVRLGAFSRADTAQEAMMRTSQVARRILDTVLRLGVPERDVQTRGLQLMPVFRHDDRTGAGQLAGYEARYELEITVRNLELVGPLVDGAVQAGANQVHGIRFTVREPDAVKQEALRQAVADGLRQARTLAEAAGSRLGPLRSVDEVQLIGPPEPRPVSAAAALPESAAPVTPGQLAFEASVLLTFDLR